MNLYEVNLKIKEKCKYNAFILVHVEENIGEDADDEAAEKALEYANNVLGIESSKLEIITVDQLK